MSREWLSAQSFERAHQLVSAINTIAIHAKLTLVGVDDSDRLPEVREARVHLIRFLEIMEPILNQVEADRDRVAMGADSRLNELAKGIVNIRRHGPRTSFLALISLAELRGLLESDDPDDLKRLVKCLRDLRRLVEQHVHADVVTILGEI